MADKEATVYIVDVGASMGQTQPGRDEPDLDWAMRYVWDKITTTASLHLKFLRACLMVCTGCHRTQDSNRWRFGFADRWYLP